MKVLNSLKTFYWSLKHELVIWKMHLLSLFPGKIGQIFRYTFLRHSLGSCGPNLVMAHHVKIGSPERLHLGSGVGIGIGAYITSGGGVFIGDNVGIGPDVKIWSVNHIYSDPDIPWKKQGSESKKVVIGDDAWIGAGSIVKPGVTIGKGAIISAGTVLSKSIPDFAIVAGNPGRVVGWRKSPATPNKSITTDSI